MLCHLDVNARAWLTEHLGAMISSKQRFLWCEANIGNIALKHGEYLYKGSPTPGNLKAIDPEASRRTVDIPDYILEGISEILFDQPMHWRPIDPLTAYMIEALELQVVHGQA